MVLTIRKDVPALRTQNLTFSAGNVKEDLILRPRFAQRFVETESGSVRRHAMMK